MSWDSSDINLLLNSKPLSLRRVTGNPCSQKILLSDRATSWADLVLSGTATVYLVRWSTQTRTNLWFSLVCGSRPTRSTDIVCHGRGGTGYLLVDTWGCGRPLNWMQLLHVSAYLLMCLFMWRHQMCSPAGSLWAWMTCDIRIVDVRWITIQQN